MYQLEEDTPMKYGYRGRRSLGTRNPVLAGLAMLSLFILVAGCDVFEESSVSELSNPIYRVFQGRLTFPTGATPYEILSGDLNRDGLTDLVTLNWSTGTTSILIAGVDSFAAPVEYTVGPSPRTGILSDLNGDGFLDIVVANESTDMLTLLFANVDGTFGQVGEVILPAGAQPGAVKAHDLNGDGFQDLIAANAGLDSVSLIIGKENGEFLDPQSIPVGQEPSGIWAGQLTGDAVAEIIVTNLVSNALSLLQFDGTTYVQTALIPCGNGPRHLSVADLDLDANLDLVVSNLNTGDLSILRGQGGGAFGAEMKYVFPGPVARIAVADFSSDTIPDVAALLFNKTGEDRQPASLFCLAFGDGTGGFKDVATYGSGWGGIGLAAADLNGDARLDLATSDLSRDTVSIIYNRGNGTFQSDRRFDLGIRPGSAVSGDFDQDGVRDIAVANRGGNSLSVMIGENNGAFRTQNPILLTASPQCLAVGDLNKDGKDDLVVHLSQQFVVWVYIAQGGGAFLPPATFNLLAENQGPPPEVTSMAVADMNNDSHLDIVTGNTKRDSVSVLLNNGAGRFETRVITEVDNYPLAVQSRDVNRDGKMDLILVSTNDPEVTTDGAEPRLARWFGNGDGAFDEASHLRVSTGAGPRALEMADLSGSGRQDAVTLHPGNNSLYLSQSVSDTGFSPGSRLSIGENPVAVALADIKRDGKNDLVCALNKGSVVVRFSRGALEFEGPNNFIVTPGIADVLVEDLNADAYPDLITINSGRNDMAVILGGPF